MLQRQEKMAREIARISSEYIERQSNRTSLITITNCEVSPDLKRVTIYISVMPRDKAQAGLDFLERHLHDLREFIKTHIRARVLPFISVEIDRGEENRQKIDELLRSV